MLETNDLEPSPQEIIKLELQKLLKQAQKCLEFVEQSWYKALKISPTTDLEIIKQAYFRAAKIFHPDATRQLFEAVIAAFPDLTGLVDQTRQGHEEAMKKLSDIYAGLSDEKTRLKYFADHQETKPAESNLSSKTIFQGTIWDQD